MLMVSLLVNVALVAALFVILARARKRIVEEKCATFAGCLGAITSGLAIDEPERRMKNVSFFLSSLYGPKAENDADDVQFYLTRASILRIFRSVALADVGEHLRLLALENVSDDDEPGNRILEYISHAEANDREPSELWGDELTEANLVAEKKIMNIYRRKIALAPVKLFG